MPCLRGIEVSLVIQPDSELLPEFPHPDASSVHVTSIAEAVQIVQENDATPSGLDSPRLQKTAPRVSVYVPSIPGSQFWVQYCIHRHPQPQCYLFFKLLMNGRIITSCGIKPGTSSGTITRALLEPSDRWHLKQDGMLLRRSGIESRSFCFSPGPDAIAAADDGGLIEVQVFRAKSRRRSTPQLSVHRDQEQYGIISPSTGLLEHPEDAVYYEWVLRDPAEAPFATFCFHYRAWGYLWDLNLVTDDGNSLLYNTRLLETPGSGQHNTTPCGKLDNEIKASHLGLDLRRCCRDDDAGVTASRTDRVHDHPQAIVHPNKELRPLEIQNSLLLRDKRNVNSSATSFRKPTNLYNHLGTLLLLPPVVEEEEASKLDERFEDETIAASPNRLLSRERHFPRSRRPLPIVNEVARLE